MIKALQGEIYKLSKNRGLKLYYVIIILLLVGEGVYSYNLWKMFHEIYLSNDKLNNYPQVLSAYWIGGDISSVFLQLYYVLFPIMAVLPFAVTYYSEIKTGYMKNVCTRIGKKKYIISKYIVSYITGGLACSCPLIVDLWITSLYAPDIPQHVSCMNSAIGNSSLWCDLFYEKPVLYAFVYIGLAFLFGGLFAVVSMATVYLCRNIFVYCVSEFLLNISGFYLLYYTNYLKLVPMVFLNPSQMIHGMTYGGIITMFVFMVVISVVGMGIHAKKDVLR